MFLAGLVFMNTVMTASARGLFRTAAPHSRIARVFVALTAVIASSLVASICCTPPTVSPFG
jgi:hypothetical protein